MNSSRKVIAVLTGLVLALGYLVLGGGGEISAPRIIVGTMFGLFQAVTMIRNPEQLTRNRVLCIACLMLGFVIFEAFQESEKLILFSIWAFLMIGLCVAFLRTSSRKIDGPESAS